MKTMIFDLPIDLREEILSRVPLISKKATRLTCKEWDTYFTKMNQRKLGTQAKEGESRMIVSMHNEIYLMSVVVNENPSAKFLGKLTCLNEQVKISRVFHCEGLLLCILEDDDTKFVVWNPYLGQTRWIETRYTDRGEKKWSTNCYTYALGYANKKSCRKHKILRLSDYPYCGVRYLLHEIYNFDSGLWRTLGVPKHWSRSFYHCHVTLKGNTYWCASQEEKRKHDFIICSDFTSERFGPLMRLPFKRGDDSYVILSCVREEKHAALVYHWKRNPNMIEIWITTKIETDKISWSKFMKVNARVPCCSMSLWNFFIDEEKKVVMGFDRNKNTSNHHTLRIIGEVGYLRKLDLEDCEDDKECWDKHIVCSYVPSLVQLSSKQ